MSERDRERLYFRLCLLFMLASPLCALMTARAGFRPDFNPLPFTFVCFLSIPLALLVELLRAALCGEQIRLWLARPTTGAGRTLSQAPAQARDEVIERLSECGFEYASEWGDGGAEVVKFGKVKSPPVYAFLENGFTGDVTLRAADAGTSLTCRLTLEDTAVLATGEDDRLRALCEYFALKSQRLSYESVPLTVTCGLAVSFVTTLVTLAPARVVSDTLLTCLALGAAGNLIASVFIMRKDPAHSIGYRLIGGGLYLASVPFLSKLVTLMF